MDFFFFWQHTLSLLLEHEEVSLANLEDLFLV